MTPVRDARQRGELHQLYHEHNPTAPEDYAKLMTELSAVDLSANAIQQYLNNTKHSESESKDSMKIFDGMFCDKLKADAARPVIKRCLLKFHGSKHNDYRWWTGTGDTAYPGDSFAGT